MLHLVLKRTWFDMISAGKKTVEHRRRIPYWEKRILKNPLPDRVVFHRAYTGEILVYGIEKIVATDETIEIHLGGKL